MSFAERLMSAVAPSREMTAREEQRLGTAAKLDLAEALPELTLAFEDAGWRRLSSRTERDLEPAELRTLMHTSRIAYIAFPLIHRGVNIRAYYTWGEGAQISGVDERVNDVLQEFVTNPVNQEEMFDAEASLTTDADAQNTGNVYTACFTDPVSGFVQVMQIDPTEIVNIVRNPENSREPWYYRREWSQSETAESGDLRTARRTGYYPDINYRPDRRPSTFGGHAVQWDSPIAHLKTNGLKHMMFGVPDTYTALDWARAHRDFLQDWASLVRSLSRFAWNLTTEGDVASAVNQIATTLGDPGRETNPAPGTGSVFVGDAGADLTAIPKTGATPTVQDSRELRMMIAAALDLPDHILSGDVDVGNLATARTLDRPTELMVSSRQRMWASYLRSILQYVIRASVRAPRGLLTGSLQRDRITGRETLVAEYDTTITVDYGDVLEHSVVDRVGAIVSAATLGGSLDAGMIPREVLVRELLTALGIEGAADIAQEVAQQAATEPDGGLAEAVRGLQEAIGGMA